MAESSVTRALRTGTAQGEHVTTVMIVDSVETTSGRSILDHFVTSLTNSIALGTAQAKGIVIVASDFGEESYTPLKATSKCVQILDCFSDPLGWERLQICQNIKDLNALLTAILARGKDAVQEQPKTRFAVVFDSVTNILRHHSLPAFSSFISKLRALECISTVMWAIHGDLYPSKVLNSLIYISTTVVYVEAQLECIGGSSLSSGRLRLRQKRRNGRVHEQLDEFEAMDVGIKFSSVDKTLKLQNASTSSHHHKVHFRLDLSEKEHVDRSKVVLPFEHQGNGREDNIYDGRSDGKSSYIEDRSSQEGTIHYLRDSDDEYPDSDEDPDDDLDF